MTSQAETRFAIIAEDGAYIWCGRHGLTDAELVNASNTARNCEYTAWYAEVQLRRTKKGVEFVGCVSPAVLLSRRKDDGGAGPTAAVAAFALRVKAAFTR